MDNLNKMFLKVQHANNEARKARAEKIANSWQGKRLQKSWQYKHYVKKREKELKAQQKAADDLLPSQVHEPLLLIVINKEQE